jgi:hypothetical protein
MGQINKIDYFCGAFLSFLVSEKVAPTLFEAGETSKIVRYSTDNDDYKIYLKYSTNAKTSTVKQIEYMKWTITFTSKDMERLQAFFENGRTNYLVCVCTNKDLKDTSIATLPFADAMKCLGDDAVNKQRTIVIKHQKASSKFSCYGTALDESNAVDAFYDFRKYFSAKELTYSA